MAAASEGRTEIEVIHQAPASPSSAGNSRADATPHEAQRPRALKTSQLGLRRDGAL